MPNCYSPTRWFCYRRRGSPHLPFACLLLGLLVELMCFEVGSWFWPIPHHHTNDNGEESLVVLVVADPQLIGYRHESPLIGGLNRWDADMYLRRGYAKAVEVVQPSLELFLGDLFDEGVEMSPNEFAQTLQRFHQIFSQRPNTNRFYIPGDNDIGGEMEPIYVHLQKRFDITFPPSINAPEQLSILTISTLNFFISYEHTFLHNGSALNTLPIILTHTPILRSSMYALKESINVHPSSILLSGHDHTARVYEEDTKAAPGDYRVLHSETEGIFKRNVVLSPSPAKEDDKHSALLEFQSPTVSYRMGFPEMGYGLLVITLINGGGEAKVEFSILWLPPRFPILILHSILAVIVFIYVGGFIAHRALHRLNDLNNNGSGRKLIIA